MPNMKTIFMSFIVFYNLSVENVFESIFIPFFISTTSLGFVIYFISHVPLLLMLLD